MKPVTQRPTRWTVASGLGLIPVFRFQSDPIPVLHKPKRCLEFCMDRFDTELKVLPTILRLGVGLVGIGGILFLSVMVPHLINEPTRLLVGMAIVYSALTFLFLGLGLFSIKTFRLNNKEIVESFLWGLVKRKSRLGLIKAFRIRMASNRLGTFEELILEKEEGDTIVIQEFDQKGFKELKNRLIPVLAEDKSIEPNYWTRSHKTLVILLVIWYAVLFGLAILNPG